MRNPPFYVSGKRPMIIPMSWCLCTRINYYTAMKIQFYAVLRLSTLHKLISKPMCRWSPQCSYVVVMIRQMQHGRQVFIYLHLVILYSLQNQCDCDTHRSYWVFNNHGVIIGYRLFLRDKLNGVLYWSSLFVMKILLSNHLVLCLQYVCENGQLFSHLIMHYCYNIMNRNPW